MFGAFLTPAGALRRACVQKIPKKFVEARGSSRSEIVQPSSHGESEGVEG